MRNDPEYVEYLEQRITRLEEALATGGAGEVYRGGLRSPNFLTRAFAVWGHFFVAQLMLAIPVYALAFFLILVLSAARSSF